MQKIVLVLTFILINCLLYGQIDDISTILIVIEESENEFVPYKEITPFTEGLFVAMWETPYIFFDMQIDKSIPFFKDDIDIRPYLEDARSSGADSVLLVKFCYELVESDNKSMFRSNDIPYMLYSLKDMKIIKSGRKKVDINKFVETNSKNKLLRSLGQDIVDLIFN